MLELRSSQFDPLQTSAVVQNSRNTHHTIQTENREVLRDCKVFGCAYGKPLCDPSLGDASDRQHEKFPETKIGIVEQLDEALVEIVPE